MLMHGPLLMPYWGELFARGECHQRDRILEWSLSGSSVPRVAPRRPRGPKALPLLTRCLPEPKPALAEIQDVPDFNGAPDTIRTCDLCLRRAIANGTRRVPVFAGTGAHAINSTKLDFS